MLIVLNFFMTFMSSVYLLLGCSNGLACVSACVSDVGLYIVGKCREVVYLPRGRSSGLSLEIKHLASNPMLLGQKL